jgi:endoglucanase
VLIIIGEFGIGTSQTEPGARWKYYDFCRNSAYNSTTSIMLWEASGSFARPTPRPRTRISTEPPPYTGHRRLDQTDLDIIIQAAKGVHNALLDSSENANDRSYWSSAQLFQKLGDPIQDTNLPLLWNSKKLACISCSGGPWQATLPEGGLLFVSSNIYTC